MASGRRLRSQQWKTHRKENRVARMVYRDQVRREIGTLGGGARVRRHRTDDARKGGRVHSQASRRIISTFENIEALEDALGECERSVLLVSHDRAFLREVATRVRDFDGALVNYEEDRRRRGGRSRLVERWTGLRACAAATCSGSVRISELQRAHAG
jgi:ATP-binding cassette subfamily F protein 3